VGNLEAELGSLPRLDPNRERSTTRARIARARIPARSFIPALAGTRDDESWTRRRGGGEAARVVCFLAKSQLNLSPLATRQSVQLCTGDDIIARYGDRERTLPDSDSRSPRCCLSPSGNWGFRIAPGRLRARRTSPRCRQCLQNDRVTAVTANHPSSRNDATAGIPRYSPSQGGGGRGRGKVE